MKVQPENQFPHSAPVVAELAKKYGLDMTSYQEAASGIENTTLIIESNQGKCVFRVYRHAKKTDEHIIAELSFMAFLESNHIPVPSVIPNVQGQLITAVAVVDIDWQVIAMEFINGRHAEELTPKLLQSMASTQARMHLLAAEYEQPHTNIRNFSELLETEFIKQIDQSNLSQELRGFLRRGANYRVQLSGTFPTGPCHLDYDEFNILSKGDAIVAVLDFDDLSVVPYVVCLAYTLWHIYNRQGEQTMQAYQAMYERLRPLGHAEQQLLYHAILFRHYMITAIKILNGQTSYRDIRSYLTNERYFQSLQA